MENNLMIATNGTCMGTTWNVSICESSFQDEAKLFEIVQTVLDNVDATMSTYKSDSEVSRFNRSLSTDWFPVSPLLFEVVQKSLEISQKTNGAFDITVGPLVNLWKFGPDKTQISQLPTEEEIESTRKFVGYRNLQTDSTTSAIKKTIPELYIDLSAIAKGYAVDLVARELEKNNINNYLVEVGGETRCNGEKMLKIESNETEKNQTTDDSIEKRPWVLGIEKPYIKKDFDETPIFLYRKVIMKDGLSLATSGDYRNYRLVDSTRFSHLIDPRTGKPTIMINENANVPMKRLGSVSVILPNCLEADAYATAFFVLGENEGIELANRLYIPVLFIIRNEQTDPPQFEEVASDSFLNKIESTKF
ncbi:MAG: FAD:protein FMN transferase [Planctomycetia bacterium]|nr:FAD:protein FMN transferase [Planctomycetia bacterium]